MLNSPAPGYNTASVNQQNIGPMNTPGIQGIPGMNGYNPYKSSYTLPSSYALPSSIDAPNPYYSQPIHPQAAQMARALKGA